MFVRELEAAMNALLPPGAAESWDRTGMLVGDPDAQVTNVAVALDPTRDSIAFAASVDANVLVTHHPLFLQPPTEVKPASGDADAVGSRIWDAVKAGISVISYHTALDANPRAARVMSDPLGLDPLDEILETVVNACEKAGILDNTLFIVTSDHGGHKKTHGQALMSDMETPFIMFGPGVKPGMITDPMMQYDVAAVLADYLHLNHPKGWRGSSPSGIFE